MLKEKTNLSDELAERLEHMIFETMKSGDKLPTEAELAERFSVGRSTVRESMKVLSARGVVTRSKGGTFVSDKMKEGLIKPFSLMLNMEIGNIENLIEIRQILELSTIRIAAERCDEKIIEELKRINWQMKEPGISEKERQERDIAFHNAIAKATGNTILTEILNALRQVIAKYLENPDALHPILDESFALHESLIDALSNHDGEKAYTLLQRYFNLVGTVPPSGLNMKGGILS